MRKIGLVLCMIGLMSFTETPTEVQKIDMLITYVKNLDGAFFIRGGKEYPPAKAAAHLSKKRKRAGDRITTAKDFIEKVASASGLSGEPYKIKLKDGSILPLQDLLTKELKRIENGK